MKLYLQCPQIPDGLVLAHANSMEHKFEWYSSPMPLPSAVYLPSTKTHCLENSKLICHHEATIENSWGEGAKISQSYWYNIEKLLAET